VFLLAGFKVYALLSNVHSWRIFYMRFSTSASLSARWLYL
jgi:hypothetical protein